MASILHEELRKAAGEATDLLGSGKPAVLDLSGIMPKRTAEPRRRRQ